MSTGPAEAAGFPKQLSPARMLGAAALAAAFFVLSGGLLFLVLEVVWQVFGLSHALTEWFWGGEANFFFTVFAFPLNFAIALAGALVVAVPLHVQLLRMNFVRWWVYAGLGAALAVPASDLAVRLVLGWDQAREISMLGLAVILQGAAMGYGFWLLVREKPARGQPANGEKGNVE